MSKMSQLSMELDELCRCGETLVGIAESLKEIFSGDDGESAKPVKDEEKPVPEKKRAKAAKEAEPVKDPEPAEEKPLTLEEVRTILAEKSRDGFTEQVREIIAKHGAKKLSEIDPMDYAAVVAEVEVL